MSWCARIHELYVLRTHAFPPLKKLLLIFLLLVFAPIAASAARYLWIGDGRGNWQTADRSSAGLLSPATARPEAVVRVFAARTVRWRGIFAVHTWIVVKEKGAPTYSRYDYTAWGEPVRTNGFAPDGRWFGAMPETIVAVDGERAEPLVPRIRYVIELRAVLPPTAIGKDFPYTGRWIGVTSSGTGVYMSLAGYVGLTIGWVEGFELNFFGAVLGFDIRRPALKFPGLGRWGLAAGM